MHVRGVGQNEALGYLLGGFALFGGIGLLAAYNDKASRKPYVRPHVIVTVNIPCKNCRRGAS